MSNASSDRNLLFGILALQRDFISPDDLIAAMHAWVDNRHRLLGDILVEQGALADTRRDQLETFVEEYLRLGQVSNLPLVQSRQVGNMPPDPASLAGLSTVGDPDRTGPFREMQPTATGTPTSAGLRFEILRPHARGGLGEVFVAHDSELNRQVALKEIQDRYADDSHSRARFLLEAEITGGLEHPGIVPVYGLGRRPDGRPFYAMRFIKGDSLKDAIERYHGASVRCQPDGGAGNHGADAPRLPRERNLELRKLLDRFLDVCNAVAYAHSRSVIHRDLKPANIMLGDYGETLVVDWGLAKAIGGTPTRSASQGPDESPLFPATAADVAATQAGTTLGTPAYMSPEQAAGRLDLVGPASDIYSLGATLYCLLTGHVPFRDSDRAELLRQVQRGEFTTPRRLNRHVPKALEAIGLKAMALKPEDRYPTANALAEDIEHWLADEPVTAYPEPLPARAQRWARHHKPLVSAVAALLLAVLALGGIALWRYQRDQAERVADQLARQTETERRVQPALRRAETLLEEGWQQTDNPNRFKVTVGRAEEAVQRAEGLLATGTPTDEVAEQVAAVRAQVDEAVRDSRLLVELDRIRLEMAVEKGGRYDTARGAARYAAVLRSYGLDETKSNEAAKLVRSSRLREALLAALEDWARVSTEPAQWRRLYVALRAAEPEPDTFRSRWRAARERRDAAALRQLAGEAPVPNLPATALANMAGDLEVTGELAAAERLLRAGQERYPNDFWLNKDLGIVLWRLKSLDEAVRFLTAALALRSDSPAVYSDLGIALVAKKDVEGGIRCHRIALKLDPKDALAHHNVAAALYAKGDKEAAIHSWRTALELDANLFAAHNDLGLALEDQGDLEGAIRCFRTAIKLDSKNAVAHNNLGVALYNKGDVEGALDCYRTAVKLDPKYAAAHSNVGAVLAEKNDLEGAMRCYRTAIKVDPKNAGAHRNLGNALQAKGDLDGAIRCFRTTIELDPGNINAHGALGQALLAQGRFAEARTATQNALQLLKPEHPLHPVASQQLRACEMFLALDAKLPAVLKGETEPADVDEQIGLAKLCQEYKKRYAVAARFYADAFAAEPKVADDLRTQHRYNAACAAALAGCGKGKDAADLDDKERTRLRQQALTWLRADLTAWGKLLDREPEQARAAVLKAMQHWRKDADLACVRGDALAKLPEAEGREWRKLWDDVGELLKNSGGRN
jgi:tetratricopeptide (TPR) repeat protein